MPAKDNCTISSSQRWRLCWKWRIKLNANEVPIDRAIRVRKRPAVVHARRAYQGENIATLEGVMRASAGDIIIIGVKGESYPVKPDIFEATYDAVLDADKESSHA